ncbi:MAG: class I SAM-dependent methyltransferase [Candidatus Eremiobacterota bacterium]
MFHPQGPTFLELARQALSATDRGYDLLAPKFDFTPFRTPDEVLEAAREYLEGTGPVGDALDLCCGTGAVLEALRPVCSRIVGVDFSAGMLELARARYPEAEFVQREVLSLGYRCEFDLVTCFGGLGHFLAEDKPALVDVVARALRPGGRFLFATSQPPAPWDRRLWMAGGFDLAMGLRNRLIRPPFVMYYLNFMLPQALRMLEDRGFRTEVLRPSQFRSPHDCLRLVVGHWPG